MFKPLVKVCCIESSLEANIALNAGADMLGLVSEMPSGPGVISLEKIAIIVDDLPPDTHTVLLTSKVTSEEIVAQHRIAKTWALQLVDRISKPELQKLRKALPETHLIQVIHVLNIDSIQEALDHQKLVDIILLDSGSPMAATRTLGGTGNVHDWELSKQICLQSRLPVFLAGGLNPENISIALTTVKPDGVDLCSGVRSNTNLDREKLSAFMVQLSLANMK